MSPARAVRMSAPVLRHPKNSQACLIQYGFQPVETGVMGGRGQ
ncbi:hypothetical protein ACFY9Q_10890 [Streptomyces sp. NPDC012389]